MCSRLSFRHANLQGWYQWDWLISHPLLTSNSSCCVSTAAALARAASSCVYMHAASLKLCADTSVVRRDTCDSIDIAHLADVCQLLLRFHHCCLGACSVKLNLCAARSNLCTELLVSKWKGSRLSCAPCSRLTASATALLPQAWRVQHHAAPDMRAGSNARCVSGAALCSVLCCNNLCTAALLCTCSLDFELIGTHRPGTHLQALVLAGSFIPRFPLFFFSLFRRGLSLCHLRDRARVKARQMS